VLRVTTEAGERVALTGAEPEALPVIDITWDARELGKLAYYAAAAGVADPERSELDAVIAADAHARYAAQVAERIERGPT
jgi:hypothetical protein